MGFGEVSIGGSGKRWMRLRCDCWILGDLCEPEELKKREHKVWSFTLRRRAKKKSNKDKNIRIIL